MISVKEAQQLIAANSPLINTETLPLEGAYARILRQNIVAERNAPPFDRSTMDGIAISLNSPHSNKFPVSGVARAGSRKVKLEDKSSCVEIMTGAVLPECCDTVIPYEEVEIVDGVATVDPSAKIKLGQFINPEGSHHKKGEVVLEAGVKLSAPQVGIVASEGVSRVTVSKMPSIAIINTGDELVELDSPIENYQVRTSNKYSLSSLLHQQGQNRISHYHIADDKDETISKLKEIIKKHDICILSGGVSKGKFDYVPSALEEIGVEKLFHRVAQKPGKPMWFGKFKEKMVFGLPGNPISSLVCMRCYVIPAIRMMMGDTEKQYRAKLQADIKFNSNLTYFVPVTIDQDELGSLTATPISFKGSGNYSALAYSDGLLELPSEKNNFLTGELYSLYPWK